MRSLLAASAVTLFWWGVAGPALGQVADDACAQPENDVVAENCLPGNDDWFIPESDPGVSAFVFPPSLNVGEPIPIYFDTAGAAADVTIYRLGYYDGAGARRVAAESFAQTTAQPACEQQVFDTGLVSCLNWSPIEIATDESWVSGVYLVHVRRLDNGGVNSAVFVLRDDERNAPLLFQQSNFTFQAYNNWGGKSVYTYNSGWDAGYCNTASGHPRGVSVSLARPYAQGELNNPIDTEYPLVRWLEQQGYDVSYATNWDTHRWGLPDAANELLDHQTFMSAGHDEYWSQAMSDAVFAARDAGVNLAFFSANTRYWRVRLEPDPWAGVGDSVMTVYKTSEAGVPDPSGHPTSTFRSSDVGSPENALIGTMYIGDNSDWFFPVRVDAEHAQDRIYRHTDLQALEPGTFVDIGHDIVGWEWGAIVENGLTPDGLDVLAVSPVIGFLMQDEGNSANGTAGIAQTEMTRYVSESGAQVFSIGTILWGWGLGARGAELIPVDPYVQQITYNALADLGLEPGSPSPDLILDGEEGVVTSDGHPVRRLDEMAPPVVANVTVDTSGSLTTSGRIVTVHWTSDRPTRGQLWIGPQAGNTYLESGVTHDYAVEHELRYDGLLPGTSYVLQIAALDEQNGMSLSEPIAFTMPANLIHALGSPLLREWRSLECFHADYPWVTIGGTVLLLAVAVGGVSWLIVRRRRAHGRPAA